MVSPRTTPPCHKEMRGVVAGVPTVRRFSSRHLSVKTTHKEKTVEKVMYIEIEGKKVTPKNEQRQVQCSATGTVHAV